MFSVLVMSLNHLDFGNAQQSRFGQQNSAKIFARHFCTGSLHWLDPPVVFYRGNYKSRAELILDPQLVCQVGVYGLGL